MNHSNTLTQLLGIAAKAKLAEITEQLLEITGGVVQLGPFAGMKLPTETSWGGGDVCPKLLGTYEQELQPYIEQCIARKPELVINIGCAEGYYAVGLARRLPEVMVYAYDTCANARDACESCARLNHTPVQIAGANPILRSIGDVSGYKCLYVIDCEGAELDYVASSEYFKHSDLIIECHDFSHPDATATIQKRLEATHDVTVVREGSRDPGMFAVLSKLNTLERYLACCEFRPGPLMHWVVAMAKG